MESNSSRNIFNERRNNILVENYRKYIEDVVDRTGFIASTVEKVERLINILQWIITKMNLKNY